MSTRSSTGPTRSCGSHPNDLWHPVGDPAIGEFESERSVPARTEPCGAGSFFDRVPDTQADHELDARGPAGNNQLFGPLPPDSTLEGPDPATDGDKRFPWVYMGPGIFQNLSTGSHPHQAGPDRPTTCRGSTTTPDRAIRRRFRSRSGPPDAPDAEAHEMRRRSISSDLTIRHGTRAVKLDDCTDVRLDHVNVFAGPHGVDIGENCHGCMLTHCVVDGGLPTVVLPQRPQGRLRVHGERQDVHQRAGRDHPPRAAGGTPELHGHHDQALRVRQRSRPAAVRHRTGVLPELGRQPRTTMRSSPRPGDHRLRIFENVIEQCLTAISFATEVPAARVAVYRNLFDLRRPTAVRPAPGPPRPGPAPRPTVSCSKATAPTGRSTCSTTRASSPTRASDTSYAHLRSYTGDSLRRSFNNIFIAVNPTPAPTCPITLLPDPNYPAATDGNCYFRVGPVHHRRAASPPLGTCSALPRTKPNGSLRHAG